MPYTYSNSYLEQLNEFGFDSFVGDDLNAATTTLSFVDGVPERGQTVTVFADPTGDVSVELVFYATSDATTEIGRITDGENADLSTSAGNTLVADTRIVSPHLEVEFVDDSGVSNTTSGSAYVR
jgi:hypothetical protein